MVNSYAMTIEAGQFKCHEVVKRNEHGKNTVQPQNSLFDKTQLNFLIIQQNINLFVFITVFDTELESIALQPKRSSGLRRDAAKAGNNAKNTATGNKISTRRASLNSSVKIGRDSPTFCCKTHPATKVPR